jgi:hypothetical protein
MITINMHIPLLIKNIILIIPIICINSPSYKLQIFAIIQVNKE